MPARHFDGVDLTAAAFAAAGRGWRVFPVDPGTKKPAISRWERRATTNPARLAYWWARDPARNIGIACGPSGLLVLDLDAPHGPAPRRWAELGVSHGRDMLALLAERAHQPDPVATFTVATPRSGEHRYFLRPPDIRMRGTVGERGRGLGWRIDARGSGCLVVAAGSLGVVDGRPVPYTVVRDDPVAPLPDWLVRALTPPPTALPAPRTAPPLPATSRRVRAYVAAAVAAECRAVAAADEGGRHVAVFAAAAALGELAGNDWITDAAITHHITAAARKHLGVAGFDSNELATTIRDGITAGRGRPRVLADRPRP